MKDTERIRMQFDNLKDRLLSDVIRLVERFKFDKAILDAEFDKALEDVQKNKPVEVKNGATAKK
jgi:guanylate kinase